MAGTGTAATNARDIMRIRQTVIGVAASFAGLVLISANASGASAASPSTDSDPVNCTIVDASPNTIVLGTTAKRVQFDVGTDCDDDYDVKWAVQAENYLGSAHVSWLAVCNYDRPADAAVFDCTHHGSTTMNMVGTGDWTGNDMAGTTHPLYSYAFVDTDGDNSADNGENADSYTDSFTLLRQTTFGSSFQVSPQEHGRKLSITGQIQHANWDIGRYQKFGAYVMLQFRPAGAEDYKDVKRVWDDGASATTTVKVTRSGFWRYRFGGSSTDAPSNSKSHYVRARR
jgi:hypothetical protein